MKPSARAVTGELDAALPRLRRYARVLTGAPREADALLLETLDRAGAASRQQLSRETLRTRLFGLMHERFVSQRSHCRAQPAPAQPNIEADAFASPPEVITQAISRSTAPEPSDLLTHFGRLPVEEREVLLLAAVEQMDYAEVATVLGVSPATVIARLRRARERMR